MDNIAALWYIRSGFEPITHSAMTAQKISRKELAARIADKIQEALGEVNPTAAGKVKKSTGNAADKLAKKFGSNMKKAEKREKATGLKAEKEAGKAKRAAKELIAKAEKKAKATAGKMEKTASPMKKDLVISAGGKA